VAVKALLLTGPSGSGKTTIAHLLLQEYPQFVFSISATTRPPRPNEVPGKDYYFLTEAEFDQELEQGGFVEWERLYSGYRYGTLHRELERIRASGRIPLFVKDVKGTLALQKKLEEGAVSVFVLPPSIEVLRERLLARAPEPPPDLEERLARAAFEIQLAPEFSFLLYNDELDKALRRLRPLIERHFS